MIKLVTFDATNTLIRLSRPLGEQYLHAARKLNVNLPVSSQVIQENFRVASKKNDADYPNYGRSLGMTAREWWKRVVHETFKSCGCSDTCGVDSVFEYLYEEYTKPHMWQAFPETPRLLEKLSERKTTMGVISNSDDRLSDVLDGLQIRRHFSFVLTGYETGVMKPSLDMFRLAVQEVGCDVDDALHVGDSLEKDYLPATRLGMKALLVSREGKGDRKEIPDIDVIQSLDGILDYIDQLPDS